MHPVEGSKCVTIANSNSIVPGCSGQLNFLGGIKELEI